MEDLGLGDIGDGRPNFVGVFAVRVLEDGEVGPPSLHLLGKRIVFCSLEEVLQPTCVDYEAFRVRGCAFVELVNVSLRSIRVLQLIIDATLETRFRHNIRSRHKSSTTLPHSFIIILIEELLPIINKPTAPKPVPILMISINVHVIRPLPAVNISADKHGPVILAPPLDSGDFAGGAGLRAQHLYHYFAVDGGGDGAGGASAGRVGP